MRFEHKKNNGETHFVNIYVHKNAKTYKFAEALLLFKPLICVLLEQIPPVKSVHHYLPYPVESSSCIVAHCRQSNLLLHICALQPPSLLTPPLPLPLIIISLHTLVGSLRLRGALYAHMIVYTYISSLGACFFYIWLMGTIIWLEYCLNVCVCTEQ